MTNNRYTVLIKNLIILTSKNTEEEEVFGII